MAISYVGGKVAGTAGQGGGSITLTSGLTGGSGGAPLAGDVVVVTVSVGTAARAPTIEISTPTGYTPLTVQRTTATTYDTNVQTCYKVMTSTPDTAVTIPASGNAADGIAYAIQVFRGVDAAVLDTTSTYATGSGTNSNPNPAAITPVTAGAWIVCCGGGAAGTGAVYTTATLTNFLSANGPDTNDGTVGVGYYTGWTSGAYDPAAFGGGSTNAANSWGATTLALRPAAEPITGDLAATETGSDTFAATGAVSDAPITGTLAATDTGSDTAAMSGAVLVEGALSATDVGSDTASLTGTVLVQGSLAATDSGADAFASSGLILVQGVLSATEESADTFVASGTVADAVAGGALAATESGADTFTASGLVLAQGALNAVESASDTADISGGVFVFASLDVVDVDDVLGAECTISETVVVQPEYHRAYFDTPSYPIRAKLSITDDADKIYASAAVDQLMNRIVTMQAFDDGDTLHANVSMMWIQPKLMQYPEIPMIRTDRRVNSRASAKVQYRQIPELVR